MIALTALVTVAALIGHAVFVVASGVGVLAEHLSDQRTERLAR